MSTPRFDRHHDDEPDGLRVPWPDCAVCGRECTSLRPVTADAQEIYRHDLSRPIRLGPSFIGWNAEPCGHHVSASLYTLEVVKPRFVYTAAAAPRAGAAAAPDSP